MGKRPLAMKNRQPKASRGSIEVGGPEPRCAAQRLRAADGAAGGEPVLRQGVPALHPVAGARPEARRMGIRVRRKLAGCLV